MRGVAAWQRVVKTWSPSLLTSVKSQNNNVCDGRRLAALFSPSFSLWRRRDRGSGARQTGGGQGRKAMTRLSFHGGGGSAWRRWRDGVAAAAAVA